jgi:hypothetical protein
MLWSSESRHIWSCIVTEWIESSTLFYDALIIQSRRWQRLYRRNRRDRLGKSVRALCRGHLLPSGTGADIRTPASPETVTT